MFNLYINADLTDECQFSLAGVRELYFVRTEDLLQVFVENGEADGLLLKPGKQFFRYKLRGASFASEADRSKNGDTHNITIKFSVPSVSKLHTDQYTRLLNTNLTAIVVMRSGFTFLVGESQPLRVKSASFSSDNFYSFELTTRQKRQVLGVTDNFLYNIGDEINGYVMSGYIELNYVF